MNYNLRPAFVAGLAASVMAACGGGNSSDKAASLRLSGTAATGAAIAGATVSVKCAAGTGTAVTRADGGFLVAIADGSLPCVLQVAPAGENALHSVIDGSGSGSATVNVSPLTELVVAKLAAQLPADLFADFDAAAQASVTASALQSAITAVAAALHGAVDLSGIDPIKDPLVAANGSTAGNGLDQKLDALQAVLAASRTTLAELATAVAASGGSDAAVQTILRPSAAGCAGLRSGRYAWLSPVGDSTASLVDIDAATLAMSYTTDDGSAGQLTLSDDGGCVYSVADDGQSSTKLLVSRSGIAVARDTATSGVNSGSSWVSGVLVPVQSIPLTELAGTWNKLEYFRDPMNGQSDFRPFYGSLVLSGSGMFTAGSECDASGACAPAEAVGAVFSVNSSGGFDVGGSSVEPPSRLFALKTADGHLSMFLVYSNGRGIVALTRQESLPLPAVGSVAHIWDFSISSNGFASALVEQTTTVIAVDAAAGTLTRLRAADNRVESYKNDDPQTGMRSRSANSCTINAAPTVCAGIISLVLPGTGISIYVPAAPQNFFGISIAKP
jgi:hypothetical protein